MHLETGLDHRSRLGEVWTKVEATITARRGVVALACIVLLSLAFRLHVSRECSLWLDEVVTKLGVLKPWSEVLQGPSRTHPPLMYWLVGGVVSLLGESDTKLRTVSLVFGCVLLLAIYELCLELGLSVGRSLVVVATFALSPFFIRHATEARHYAIMAAFITLATTRTLRTLRGLPRARDLIGFAAAAAAAACTHYFAVAYALALLAAVAVGLASRWKQIRPLRLLALAGLLAGLLALLGMVVARALAVGRHYAVDEAAAPLKPTFNLELLLEIAREFSFSTRDAWALAQQPLLAVIGLALLSARLSGVARLLPFGLGVAPCVAALFVSSEHFLAARYLAPSVVFYHLGACVALFAAIEQVRQTFARVAALDLLGPLVGLGLLALVVSARVREFPKGFGAGLEDYRGLQRYFVTNLARDTALVTHVGLFGQQIFGKHYRVGSWPINLGKFRPRRGIDRYLVAEIHIQGDERRAELEALVRRHFGLSAEAWRSLPLVPLPHSIYQPAVTARLVELRSERRRYEKRNRKP